MSDTTIMIKSPYSYARSLSDWSPFVDRAATARDTFHFQLRQAHIVLLQEASWEWDDNFTPGAPLVDAKRPFGNSGRLRIPLDIYRLVDDSDPDTLLEMSISDTYESDSESNADDFDADTQALNGLWAECALALSVMFECAGKGEVCKAGTSWKISRDETWHRK